VLDDVAAPGDVQHLEAATDREHGQIPLERRLQERELALVALGVRADSRRMGVGAVLLRLQVVAAGEDQPVERVEQLLDAVIAGRHEHRAPAGPLDRQYVVVRDERCLALPVAPGCGLDVRRDADHGLPRHSLSVEPDRLPSRGCIG
jgi:hypothetical protein